MFIANSSLGRNETRFHAKSAVLSSVVNMGTFRMDLTTSMVFVSVQTIDCDIGYEYGTTETTLGGWCVLIPRIPHFPAAQSLPRTRVINL